MRRNLFAAVVAGAALTAVFGGTHVARADTTPTASATIYVPQDFVPALSDTRSDGHYAVEGTGLHIWTTSNGSQAKVAEYVATNKPLADVSEPTLDYTTNSGTIPPGFQLVVNFNCGSPSEGILVGEPTYYGTDWWASNGSAACVKAGAPVVSGGSGSPYHGTLTQWRAAFPDANVDAFGFSLGSGVQGDYLLNAINFAGTRYTFAQFDKNDCKNGGWATSTNPVYKNQGQCVSQFAGGM